MSNFDSSAAVFKSRANKLASLMATGGERARLWRPEDLAAIFRHQLSAPMAADLGALDTPAAARLQGLVEAQGRPLRSFADLLLHPAPPLELLEMVKAFAKANIDHPESGLPGEIAAALYYTSIAAALVRLDQRISQLSDTALQAGLRCTLAQTWLDDPTRELLARALAKISGESKGGAS